MWSSPYELARDDLRVDPPLPRWWSRFPIIRAVAVRLDAARLLNIMGSCVRVSPDKRALTTEFTVKGLQKVQQLL